MAKKEDKNLGQLIKSLSNISQWFDSQEEIDIELGLQKIKEATSLIKESRKKIKEVENEFKEIKKEL